MNNFELKFQSFIAANHKFISDFTKDGSTFTMVNVSIDVVVVLNGVNHYFYVKELAPIRDFLDDIYQLTGHDHEISLFYYGRQLEEADNLASYGVEQGCTLTAVNGKPRSLRRITITYRDKTHQIEIDQEKSVLELKEAVSNITKIETNHFNLCLHNTILCDHKKILTYIKAGSNCKMVNVIIRVKVVLHEKQYSFYMNESNIVNYLKKEIATQTTISDKMTLVFRKGVLDETNTLLESGIRNNDLVIAVIENERISGIQEFTVTYRDESHIIAMDTSNTVLKLKEKVSEVTKINTKNFKLGLYWISLADDKPLSKYVMYGTKLRMKNVIIDVLVKIDQRVFTFSVNEDISIDELGQEIIKKTGQNKIPRLVYQGDILEGDKTLKQSGVEIGCQIMGISSVTGALCVS